MLFTAKEFTCTFKNCNKYFKDPVTLPCGYSICQEHLENLDELCCQFCEEMHKVPEDGFQLTKSLIKVMNSERYLTEKQILAKDLITELESLTNGINLMINDPEKFLFEYFSSIKNCINNEKENAVKKIETIYDDYLLKVSDYEVECRANLKRFGFKNNLVEININRDTLQKLKEDFRYPDENAIDQLLDELKEFIYLSDSKLESYKNELLANKSCSFQSKSFDFTPDLFGELKFENPKFNLSEHFGTCLQTFSGHENSVLCVKIAESHKRVISISHDSTIKVWNIETGECISTLKQESEIFSICLISESTFVTGSSDGFIKVWNLNNLEESHLFIKENDPIYCLCLLSNNLLAIGMHQRSILICNLANLDVVNQLIGSTKHSLRLKCTNNKLLISSCDASIEIWDINTMEWLHTLRGHTDKILAIDFSSDGSLLFSGSLDGTLKVWDFENGDCLNTVNFKQKIYSMKCVSKGILTLGLSDEVDYLVGYDVVQNKIFKKIQEHNGIIYNLEQLANGNLVSCSADGSIKIWKI